MSTRTVESLVEELEDLCKEDGRGDQLSLAALRRKLTAIPPSALHGSPFFHHVCDNSDATLEIVDYILDAVPEAAHMTTGVFDVHGQGVSLAHPVHLACRNRFCPNSVIQLLVEKNPAALGRLALLGDGIDYSHDDWWEEGFPLHYYFTRTSIDLDTVKMLVEACPEALAAGQDESTVVPVILTLFCNYYSSEVDSILSDIIEFIDSVSPSSIRSTTWQGSTPLHIACEYGHLGEKIMQLLLGAWPESVKLRDGEGRLPIHVLCRNTWGEEDSAIECLSFLVEAHPQSTMEPDREGRLPIHLAVARRSPAFCEMLMEANLASLRIADNYGGLPIHIVLVDLEVIGHRDEVLRILLKKDPGTASKATANEERYLPLHLACSVGWKSVAEIVFDAFPEALCARDGDGQTPLDFARQERGQELAWERGQQASAVISFLEAQIAFVREAQSNGNVFGLTLRALTVNAPFGTIKLLVKHDLSSLHEHDENNSSLLHCACRRGNLRAVGYLLEAHGFLAEERNSDNKLPIHLLWECNEDDVDRNSPGYVEAVWKLLLASPTDTLLGY